jgi:hypothetical protein
MKFLISLGLLFKLNLEVLNKLKKTIKILHKNACFAFKTMHFINIPNYRRLYH